MSDKTLKDLKVDAHIAVLHAVVQRARQAGVVRAPRAAAAGALLGLVTGLYPAGSEADVDHLSSAGSAWCSRFSVAAPLLRQFPPVARSDSDARCNDTEYSQCGTGGAWGDGQDNSCRFVPLQGRRRVSGRFGRRWQQPA